MANEIRSRTAGVAGVLTSAFSGTTMTSDALADLPVIDATDYAPVTLFRTDNNGRITKKEIVYVTAHSSSATTATALKGQEGTSDQGDWAAGDSWVHGPTPLDFTRTRQTVAVTSSSLADGASQQTSVVMAQGFRLIHLQTDKAARVEVYTNAANQAADASRAVGTDPGAGSGVVLDYVTTGAQSSDLSPMPEGHNTEATPNATVPVTITNKSGVTGTVTVTFTWQQTEG